MKSYQQVSEMLKTADGQKSYLAWAESPMTGLMLRAAREIARPQSNNQALTDADKFIAFGEAIGGNKVIDYLEAPYGSGSRSTADAGALSSSYGSAEILKEMQNNG